MRNKIKQMIKKEEGFTLVELLAVIVILGIIVAIAIPSIGSLLDTADTDAEEAETVLILDAARLYEIENGSIGSGTDNITVNDLITGGFLELRESNIDPENSTVIRSDDGLELSRTVLSDPE